MPRGILGFCPCRRTGRLSGGGPPRCVHYRFFFQAEDGIRDYKVTGVQTCALPISKRIRQSQRTPGKTRRLAIETTSSTPVTTVAIFDLIATRHIWNARNQDLPRSASKRSEERRVGKECRSRWSPYH